MLNKTLKVDIEFIYKIKSTNPGEYPNIQLSSTQNADKRFYEAK